MVIGPLNGVKILEFAGIGPGPYCGQLLADMVRIKSLAKPVRISDSMLTGRLQELIKQLELRELTGFYHLLLENFSMSTGAISYNAQGLLEDVIIFWQNLNRDARQ